MPPSGYRTRSVTAPERAPAVRLADVLGYMAARGFTREAGSAAATSKETWTTVPAGLSAADAHRVRRDGLLWHELLRARCRHGRTRLMWAASVGRAARVEELLAWGAPVDARAAQGWTALHFAAFFGHAECCGLLIAAGARLDARTHDGSTPLMVAQ